MSYLRRSSPDVLRVLDVDDQDLHVAVDALEDGSVHRFICRSWDRVSICHVVSLAVREAIEASSAEVSQAEHRAEAEGPELIDVIDDDSIVSSMLQRMLRHHGFRTRSFRDGGAALRATLEEPPAMALVDLVLPRLGGLEVVRHLKGIYAGAVPVIAMSGLTNPDARTEALRVGADDFIGKPVTYEKVMGRIEMLKRIRRAYLEIREVTNRAEQLSLYAQEAASLLAHDLNNGLSIASLNLSVLASEPGLSQEGQQACSSTNAILIKLATLVSNFVDVTRLEENQLTANAVLTDLSAMLRLVVEVHAPLATDLGVSLDLDCEPSLSHAIDPSLIERVLHNLVNNSMRYAGPGGRIRLGARIDTDGSLVLEVGNTGPALATDAVDTLFQKFARGNDGNARRGMGLYFCALACRAHKGTIRLAPREDMPATFEVRLPET